MSPGSAMVAGVLKIIPLGGLGEVGLNCMAIDHGEDRFLIDCGVKFPRPDDLGVDVLVPDFSFLREHPEKLRAVVLTHAHEDHLGALPWLLREFPVPVYGTRFTLRVLNGKLEEYGIHADLREIAPREVFSIGDALSVEPIRVTHSVPDAVGLAIKTPNEVVIHTGDFKLDGVSMDGRLTDLERLGELGDRGVSCLLSDSTNSERPGTTRSEAEVRANLDRLFTHCQGRLVLALFGSHLFRIQIACELAASLGRKVVLAGRSVERNVSLAIEAGILTLPSDLIISAEASLGLPKKQVLVIATGAQGEPRAALPMMLEDKGATLQLGKDDTVVLSSRVIPGNELYVLDLTNRCLERGAIVIDSHTEPGIHSSGHASQDEQKRMIEAVRPATFIPIHGEMRHLTRHLETARQTGVAPAGLCLIRNGEVVGIEGRQWMTAGQAVSGSAFFRRDGEAPVGRDVLNERRKLAENGVIVVTVTLKGGGSVLLSGPSVEAIGLGSEEKAILSIARDNARMALEEISKALWGNPEIVKDALIAGVRRTFKQLSGRKPVVIPVVNYAG